MVAMQTTRCIQQFSTLSAAPALALRMSWGFVAFMRSRAARAALPELTLGPTSVSGQFCLGDHLDRSVAPTQIRSEQTRRTRCYHRHNWPETDVGPSVSSGSAARAARGLINTKKPKTCTYTPMDSQPLSHQKP